MIEPQYLGDGVYIQPHASDPTCLTMTTGSHIEADADNRIVLETEVIEFLLAYITRWKESLNARSTDL